MINIQKASGTNRARSEAKREQALKEHLRRIGMDLDAYEALVAQANQPWYRNGTHILIPSHQLYGCLIEGAKTLSASQRPCDPTNLRHLLQVSDFVTDKTTEDGIYERLVMPKSGTGQPLSNQRALRKNPFITQFRATGTLGWFETDFPEAQPLLDFVAYCGARVGVGASRKMGFGRFHLEGSGRGSARHAARAAEDTPSENLSFGNPGVQAGEENGGSAGAIPCVREDISIA